MKALFASILMFVASAYVSFGTDLTNGVFYIDQATECRLISQNGSSLTNQLTAGKTYLVGDVLLEIDLTNKTTFFFSGGPLIEATPLSSLSINVFDQEVKNLDAQPRKAEFGSLNLSLMFTKGEFSVIYPNADPNSSFTISTPYATYQLHSGKFFFRVSEKSSIAYVLEGMMEVHGDKNSIEKTEKGKLAVAVPFSDPSSGVPDKIVSNIKSLKQDDADRFGSPLLLAERKWGNVQFIIVNGRVIGAWMK